MIEQFEGKQCNNENDFYGFSVECLPSFQNLKSKLIEAIMDMRW